MPEHQNVEYKESWRDEYLKWVCGFANASGGRLYIGIDDEGKVKGVANFRNLLEELPNKFRDILGVYAEINLLYEHEKSYLEITIPRYEVPISLRGVYYLRSGSTLQELKGPSLSEFLLRKTGRSWDSLPEPSSTLNDIDASTLEKFVLEVSKDNRLPIEPNLLPEELLEKLRLTENGVIKKAAIVLFGKDPEKFYPNTALKIGRFGQSEADLKYHEVVSGNLIQVLQNTISLLNSKFFIHPIHFEGIQRIEKDEYPVAAVREMILNALVHRSYTHTQIQIRVYDNSFSIWNDGSLPEGITVENLRQKHASKPRNPLIADICFKMGYIDSWGRGTLKILEACHEASLPEPEMKEQNGGFSFTLFKAPQPAFQQADLNKRQIQAIAYLKENGKITNKEYQQLFKVSRETATRDLSDLVKKNLISAAGSKGAGSFFILT